MKNNLPATKEDLKNAVAKLATKEELKSEIAKLDTKLGQTEKILRTELKNSERVIRAGIQLDFEDFRQEINEKLDKKFGLMPTKNEFFNAMDKIMGELQTNREENTISSHQLLNHEDRITVLEQKTGIAVAS